MLVSSPQISSFVNDFHAYTVSPLIEDGKLLVNTLISTTKKIPGAKKIPGIVGAVTSMLPILILQKLIRSTESEVQKVEPSSLIPIAIVACMASEILSDLIYSVLMGKLFPKKRIIDKVFALRNWQQGVLIGRIGLIAYQFINIVKNKSYGTSIGLILQSWIDIKILSNAFVTKENVTINEEKYKLVNWMSPIIKKAIDDKLFEEEDVILFTKLKPLQSIIVYKSLLSLSAADFCLLFRKLATTSYYREEFLASLELYSMDKKINRLSKVDQEILEMRLKKKPTLNIPENFNQVDKLHKKIICYAFFNFVNIIKNRLNDLTKKELQLLENRLFLKVGQGNSQKVDSLFLAISNVSGSLWNVYSNELNNAIERLEDDDSFLYKKFIEFLS